VKKKNKNNITKIGILATFIFMLLAFPVNTSAAAPVISIETDKDVFNVGDEVAFEYKLDTQGSNILSVDLIFSYNPSVLEFQDDDLAQTGVQINTSSSALGTITKKIVNPTVGEIQFGGSKIGGLSGEVTLFQAIYKILDAGDTSLNIDSLSKIYDISDTVEHEFTALDISTTSENDTLADDTEEPEYTNSSDLTIIHISPETAASNQDQYVEITVTPQDKVNEARFYYKNSIDSSWNPIKMTKTTDNKFQGLIPKEKMIIGQLQYFFGIMDVNELPHRNPVEDDQFYTLEIALNTTPVVGNNDIETVPDTETPVYTPITNKSPNFNTAASGPEHVIAFILAGIIAVFYAFHSEKKKKH